MNVGVASYQPGKKKAHNKTLAERMKLKHKYKREMKVKQ